MRGEVDGVVADAFVVTGDQSRDRLLGRSEEGGQVVEQPLLHEVDPVVASFEICGGPWIVLLPRGCGPIDHVGRGGAQLADVLAQSRRQGRSVDPGEGVDTCVRRWPDRRTLLTDRRTATTACVVKHAV